MLDKDCRLQTVKAASTSPQGDRDSNLYDKLSNV
jgi:hypothetical protein